MAVLQAFGLILAGLLAGEEFIVRYGVQPALLRLDDRAHIQARVALVRSLRVVVPAIMLPAVAVAVAVLVLADGPGTAWRWAGVAALAAFLGFSFLGTVPINMKVAGWDPDAPPADWRDRHPVAAPRRAAVLGRDRGLRLFRDGTGGTTGIGFGFLARGNASCGECGEVAG
nr:hypothetical protein GCM10020063_049650 [Dactylosporangium thailandense]